MANTIPPQREPLIDNEGRMNPNWYRFFAGMMRSVDADSVLAGSGLTGTTTLSIADNGVTNAMLRDSLGCSVIGRADDSVGNPGDIVAAANGRVLMRVDDILVFREITPGMGTIGDGDYGDISVSGGVWSLDAGVVGTTELAGDAVTFAKLQNIATDRLIGRDTAASGDPEEITVGGGLEFTGSAGIQTSAFTGDATKAAGGTVLTLATVNANVGSFGSASQVATFTVNGKGLLTAAGNTSISITASQVSDFSTAADARITAAIGVSVQAFDADLTTLGAGGTGARDFLGLGTGDSPQFTAVNLGHASDTTLTRMGAGDIAVEGNAVYRAGGTDVPVTDGGTGASSASDARTNLGLGTMATQNANAVAITGGTAALTAGAGVTPFSVAGAGAAMYIGYVGGGTSYYDATTHRFSNAAETVAFCDIIQAGIEPGVDNTQYLGKNDDDSPKAWKGLILKDQAGTGKYYRLEVNSNTLLLVDLTD